MRDAGPEVRWGLPQRIQGVQQMGGQFDDLIGPAVRERAFGGGPDAFVRIAFWRVGGEGFQVQARAGTAQGAPRRALVDSPVIPQDDHRARQLPQQVAEKRADLSVLEIFRMDIEVQIDVLAARTDRECRDHRQLVAASPVADERRLPARGPGPAHAGRQREARFVEEREVGAQPRSVFFTCGHRVCFHRVMAASSRSRARRSGFWALHPRRCSRRPT